MPKPIRDILDSQQQQIEQLTGLLRTVTGVGGVDHTVAELCDKWEVAVRGERAKATIRPVLSRLRTIRIAKGDAWEGALGDVRVSELTPLHFESYQRSRRKDVSDSAVRAEAIVLRSVLNWARKKRLVKGNPFDGAEMLCTVRTRQTVYKTRQVYAVYNWLLHRSKEVRGHHAQSAGRYLDAAAAVLACASTGIRPKELCLLQVAQLRSDSHDIAIRKEQSKGGYSARTVRLSEDAHAALLTRVAGRSSGPILQAGYRAIAERWREACTAMGIVAADGETPQMYSLRHSFASVAATKVPVWALMKAMGHASVTTTQRYVKVDFSQAAVAFESVHAHLSDNDGEAQDK